MLLICANCGRENPEGSRFCNSCGAPLEAQQSAPRRERKFVTVVFCDLVGFTARAERLDPEDVAQTLSAYHASLRDELERFGGTVEKFIGDAVVAIFGAPIAHEDDPERAVRAALSIRDKIATRGDLDLRIAVNTGEALVSLDARHLEGEGMAAGDIVNTTQRMQSAAPTNAIVVGEETYRATRGVIEYEDSHPIAAKGKAEPIAVWVALRARVGVGDLRSASTPLMGRRRELELLLAAVARAQEERSPQLVTVVGVPGIGKSRLLLELDQALEREGVTVRWLRGRCLPYGEGVTFWALGEIVKAHAGILESDGPERVAEKLAASIRQVLGPDESTWIETQLKPLVGVEAARQPAGARRQEAFGAWLRLIEAIAEKETTVLAFEDLHWADEGLLDFVDYLVEWAHDVPLLVACTGRPETLTRRPHWGGGKTNAMTIALSPLTDEETTELVHAVAERAVLPAEVQQNLVARAGGNPLYAEEFARLLIEQSPENGIPQRMPQTVQGIIAARLDGLPGAEKRLLQDAAVVGGTFWVGAVSSLGDVARSDVEERLHALQRKEFVRPVRSASVDGEDEFRFHHVLVRDVAYNQIPRADRADKHRAAAGWIAALGRPGDHAEMLAHHFVTAMDLQRAVGSDDRELGEAAVTALQTAGDRAMGLSAFAAASRFYKTAAELCRDEARRARFLLRAGQASFSADGTGSEDLRAASEAFRALGQAEGAADAAYWMAELHWYRGDRDKAYGYIESALELLAPRPPSREKVEALLKRAGFHLVTAEFEGASLARDALPLAEELGLAPLRARALSIIGWARLGKGDERGVDDLREAVNIATEVKSYDQLHAAFENLRSAQFALGQLSAASATLAQHGAILERIGGPNGRWVQELRAADAFRVGEWDEALRLCDAFVRDAERGNPHYLEPPCRALRSIIELARGDRSASVADVERALELARQAKDVQVLSHALAGAGAIRLSERRRVEADALVDELIELRAPLVFPLTFGWPTFADVAWLLVDLGRLEDLRTLIDVVPLSTPWADAAVAILSEDALRAANVLGAMGDGPGEAEAHLRAGRTLLARGSRTEAKVEMIKALEFYRRVDARAWVSRAEMELEASA